MISPMLLPLTLAIAWVPTVADPAPLRPIEAHVTDDVRSGWRRPVHVDAVEAWIVGTGGEEPRWRPIEPNDSHQYAIPRGGWGRFIFETTTETPAVLEASAFGEAWINGLPRGGDVYGKNNTRLPFLMRAGRNEVLLRSGRGSPAPTVYTADMLAHMESAPGAPRVATLSRRDRTLPDAIEGEQIDDWAGVILHNIDATPLSGAHVEADLDGTVTITPVPEIPALSFLKIPVRMRGDAANDDRDVTLRLRDASGALLHVDRFTLRARTPGQWHRRTFLSDIDSSVQYYAVRPAVGESENPPGIVLSLHGAGVEAGGQARCFRGREWCHVVAPTNRRPFGFDWEDWGRLDALEVLADVRTRYANTPDRTWLTGHSMGGHGTWNVGLTVPDRWAAIAPSAGWATFWSYGGPDRYPEDGVRGVLHRAANPSDTMLVLPNADRFGIYVLHGDQDGTVPVSEARTMRRALSKFHPDFAYFEQPGAGHWWGDQCMDWPPLFEFLDRHTLGTGGNRDQLTFVTVDPAASSRCDWAVIEQQQRSLEPSRIDLVVTRNGNATTITGKTDNVERIAIDPAHRGIAAGDAVSFELDDQRVGPLETTVDGMVHLRRDAVGDWHAATPAPPDEKNPHRAGRLRTAWNHDILLVVGTGGTEEETRWNRARARQDAERWWYRGNGLVEIIDDYDFNPAFEPNRGVMLYGHADSNGAWRSLLGDSPVQIHRDRIEVGDRVVDAPAMAAFVRPRPGSDTASVGVVAGTSGAGSRLAATVPLFFAGVGWPDWIVIEPSSLQVAEDGILGAGFFGNDWALDPDQGAWRDTP